MVGVTGMSNRFLAQGLAGTGISTVDSVPGAGVSTGAGVSGVGVTEMPPGVREGGIAPVAGGVGGAALPVSLLGVALFRNSFTRLHWEGLETLKTVRAGVPSTTRAQRGDDGIESCGT